MANGRVYEQIPHPQVRYAYLAIEADTWNQFEALRSEALKKHPLYSTSAFEQASAAAAAGVEVQEAPGVAVPSGTVPEQPAEVAPAEEAVSAETAPAAGPTSTAGLSPREIAKRRMDERKGA